MTIPRTTAKKLSTEVEYRLIDESFAPQVKSLSEKGLAQRVQRARAARDKYRSLAERQAREARGRVAPRGKHAAAGNKNTVIKQKLFEETLARYEKQSAQMNGVASRKSGTGATASTTKRTVSTAASMKKSASTKKAAPAVQKSAKTATTAKAGKAASAKTARPAKVTKAVSAQAKQKSAVAEKRTGKQADAAAQDASSGAASRTTAVQAVSAQKAAGKRNATADKSGRAAKKKDAAPSIASKPAAEKSSKKKAKSRTSASRSATLTTPVEIPPLQQVMAAVSEAVAARKEGEYSAAPIPPPRSPKAPAITNDGAPPGIHHNTSPLQAEEENPMDSELELAPPDPSRLGSGSRRQQARRPSR